MAGKTSPRCDLACRLPRGTRNGRNFGILFPLSDWLTYQKKTTSTVFLTVAMAKGEEKKEDSALRFQLPAYNPREGGRVHGTTMSNHPIRKCVYGT